MTGLSPLGLEALDSYMVKLPSIPSIIDTCYLVKISI